MNDQHSFLDAGRIDSDPYSRFLSAEFKLNDAIIRARMNESFEEFLEIFDKFYAEDIEVSQEEIGEPIRGKTRVGSILLNFLIPLHITAEVGGLKVSIRQTAETGDVPDETNSSWRLELVGSSGKRCALTWRTFRKWKQDLVVREHHYQLERTGDPLTFEDLWGTLHSPELSQEAAGSNEENERN